MMSQTLAKQIQDLHDNEGYFQGDNWTALERLIKDSLKEKKMYSKEEVIKLCQRMINVIGRDEQSEITMRLNYRQFIEENLT